MYARSPAVEIFPANELSKTISGAFNNTTLIDAIPAIGISPSIFSQLSGER